MSGDAALAALLAEAEAALRQMDRLELADRLGCRALSERDRIRTWPFQIEQLQEAGQDGGDLIGYWCRGHVNRHDFAEAANDYSGAFEAHDDRNVRAGDPRHIWWRIVPMAGEPGQSRFHDAEPGARGAFPATVADVVQRKRMREISNQIAENRRHHGVGFSTGVAWAIRIAQSGGAETIADLILHSFRNGAGDRAQQETE